MRGFPISNTISRCSLLLVATLLLCSIMSYSTVVAQPYGKGVYGADVPYGNLTSISIGLSSAVNMTLAPSGPNLSGSGSQTVTVTSTDVVGYNLYINATTSTSMTNGTDTIAASGNLSDAPLTVSSWGYNTTGSTTNFTGMTLSQVQLKDANGPFKNGDATSVTYGVLISTAKSSGVYTVDVTYTAIGKS